MTNPSRPSRFGGLKAMKERGELPALDAAPLGTEETQETPTGQRDTAQPTAETPAVAPQIAQEATKPADGGKMRSERPRPQKGDKAVGGGQGERRGPGRPPGKRSDEEYRQVSALIRRATYKATQRRLLDEDGEFSELVQRLLDRWLRGEIKA